MRKAEYWAQWWTITDGRAHELRDCTLAEVLQCWGAKNANRQSLEI